MSGFFTIFISFGNFFAFNKFFQFQTFSSKVSTFSCITSFLFPILSLVSILIFQWERNFPVKIFINEWFLGFVNTNFRGGGEILFFDMFEQFCDPFLFT